MTTVRLREFGKTGTQMRQAKLSIVSILFLPTATPQPVEYQPWAPDRPYDGGTKYNCMLLKVISKKYLTLLFTNVAGDSRGLRYNVGNNNES